MTLWTRRSAMGLGVGLSTAALAGCSELFEPASPPAPNPQGYCVPRAQLELRDQLGGANLIYEENNRAESFNIDADFADQLDAWLGFFNEQSGLPAPDRLRTYGAWTDGTGSDACGSWHNSGRGLDIARLVSGDTETVSCRFDLWRDRGDLELQRPRYWALAASLYRHFSYVVTYAYNDLHRNHIHVDNAASGAELARFYTGSETQVQGVQAISTYLFGSEVEITGSWDRPTRRATDRILDELGIGGRLTDDGAWTAFMGAATGRGV